MDIRSKALAYAGNTTAFEHLVLMLLVAILDAVRASQRAKE